MATFTGLGIYPDVGHPSGKNTLCFCFRSHRRPAPRRRQRSLGLCDCPEGCPHVLVALLCHQPLQELHRTAPGYVASGKSGFAAWPGLRPSFPHLPCCLLLRAHSSASDQGLIQQPARGLLGSGVRHPSEVGKGSEWYSKEGKSESEGFSYHVCLSPGSGRNLYQKLLKTDLTIYR